MRRIAPAFKLLMLSLKNASGLADCSAIIIWLMLAPVPWLASEAMPYKVSPRFTAICPAAGVARTACGGGAGCGTAFGFDAALGFGGMVGFGFGGGFGRDEGCTGCAFFACGCGVACGCGGRCVFGCGAGVGGGCAASGFACGGGSSAGGADATGCRCVATGASATGAVWTAGAGASITGFNSTTNSRTCLPWRVFTCSRKSRYGSLTGWVLVTRISFCPLLSLTTWKRSVWSVGVRCRPARAKSSGEASATVSPSSSDRFFGCRGIAATSGWFSADLTWICPNWSAHAGAAATANSAALAMRILYFMEPNPWRRSGCGDPPPDATPRAQRKGIAESANRQTGSAKMCCRSMARRSAGPRSTGGRQLLLQCGDFVIALLQALFAIRVLPLHVRHLRLQLGISVLRLRNLRH